MFKDRTSDIGYPRPFTSYYPPSTSTSTVTTRRSSTFQPSHDLLRQLVIVRQSVSHYTDEIFEVWSRDRLFRDFSFFGNINIIVNSKQQQQQQEEECLRVSRGLVVGRGIEVRKVSIM